LFNKHALVGKLRGLIDGKAGRSFIANTHRESATLKNMLHACFDDCAVREEELLCLSFGDDLALLSVILQTNHACVESWRAAEVLAAIAVPAAAFDWDAFLLLTAELHAFSTHAFLALVIPLLMVIALRPRNAGTVLACSLFAAVCVSAARTLTNAGISATLQPSIADTTGFFAMHICTARSCAGRRR
jgi:hypothetical protein